MDAATNAFLLKFHAWFFLGTAVALAPALATSSAAAPYTMGTALCAVIAAWHALATRPPGGVTMQLAAGNALSH